MDGHDKVGRVRPRLSDDGLEQARVMREDLSEPSAESRKRESVSAFLTRERKRRNSLVVRRVLMLPLELLTDLDRELVGLASTCSRRIEGISSHSPPRLNESETNAKLTEIVKRLEIE